MKKADSLPVALRRTFDAIEHQVHHQRGNYNEQWKRREIRGWWEDGLDDAGIFAGQIYGARFVEELLAEC